MLHVERFVNQLMTSNCYIVVDEESRHCLCIDPASEKSEREIAYIEQRGLLMDYIILTHEHTDHTWGVNALVDYSPDAKVICSKVCKENLAQEFQAYFLLYFDNPDYHYNVCKVDEIIDEIGGFMHWQGHEVKFVPTPGHSLGSICVDVDGSVFTGDTIMPFKPYFSGRGSDVDLWVQSVRCVLDNYPLCSIIYPGHGNPNELDKWYEEFGHYLSQFEKRLKRL